LSRVPGLHLALALAIALGSYLKLAMLWRAGGGDGSDERQPGWGRFVLRLVVSCALMSVFLLVGRWLWPDWNVHFWVRAMRVAVLVGGGAATFAAVQYAMGFRIGHLRGI
jgi:putative peptidoglycan lipid II flippase